MYEVQMREMVPPACTRHAPGPHVGSRLQVCGYCAAGVGLLHRDTSLVRKSLLLMSEVPLYVPAPTRHASRPTSPSGSARHPCTSRGTPLRRAKYP